MFDYEDDPNDDGTTDPVEFARLEHELAALHLKLVNEEIPETEYNTAKLPMQSVRLFDNQLVTKL